MNKNSADFINDNENYKKYLLMQNSSDYLYLNQYYNQTTIMDVFNIARNELAHSAFLAWVFSADSSHLMGDYAFKKLLELLCVAKSDIENCDFTKYLKSGKYVTESINVFTEASFKSSVSGRFDILIVADLKLENNRAKQIIVAVENKVKSTENDNQTNKYAEFLFNNKCANAADIQKMKVIKNAGVEIKDPTVICVYLERGKTDVNEKFINISYQSLLDYVLEPACSYCTNTAEKERIKEYIRCLGQERHFFNTHGEKMNDSVILAVSENESERIKRLYNNHSEIIDLIFDSIINKKDIISKDEVVFWRAIAAAMLHKDILDDPEMLSTLERVNKNARREKHKFVFNGVSYISYDSKKNMGQLGKDMIIYAIEKKLNDKSRKGIEELRKTLIKKFSYANWLREIMLFEDEVKTFPVQVNSAVNITESEKDFKDSFFINDAYKTCNTKLYFVKWFNVEYFDNLSDALGLTDEEKPKLITVLRH